ncbi:MAG: single-stranded DNA-binding protein [Ruminiclostridium sp.]|nr:single-stranded DNA-binding protein [Ruminiclostridium sp.]MBP3856931.1 single-stranded DNA-binding protein [Ruminiclostridium sp.]
MAKENFVLLSGQVYQEPMIISAIDGTPLKAYLIMKTVRRHILRENIAEVSNSRTFDFVPIASFNPDCIAILRNIRVNDMIELRGVYTTKCNIKKSYCAVCGEEIITPGTMTFITPIFIRLLERAKCDDAPDGFPIINGLSILRQQAEISNCVKIIGYLCREPEMITTDKYVITQYQLASNRKFLIKEDDPAARTDYPWVKSYGAQAQMDINSLHTGSMVFIDGCVQARRFPVTRQCSKGHANMSEELACEIVPYSVEYLSDCTLPEPTERKPEGTS